MPIPAFILALRKKIGHDLLWLPGVTAVVQNDAGEILLVCRSDNGAWTPVTGIVDPGEEPGVAAAREVLEETGVIATVDRLASTGASEVVEHVNGDRAAYLDLTFACHHVSGTPSAADDESTDARWFPRDAFPEMHPAFHQRIDAALSDDPRARFIR